MQRGNRWRRLLELSGRGSPAKESVLTAVLLAEASSTVGDGAGAERVLREALVARPDEVVLLGALGRLLERQGAFRLGEVIECYRAARAVRPDLGIALGKTLVDAGRAEEGEAVLRSLVRQQPNKSEMHFYLQRHGRRLGQ
jgi:predicted Zn-dependent protease